MPLWVYILCLYILCLICLYTITALFSIFKFLLKNPSQHITVIFSHFYLVPFNSCLRFFAISRSPSDKLYSIDKHSDFLWVASTTILEWVRKMQRVCTCNHVRVCLEAKLIKQGKVHLQLLLVLFQFLTPWTALERTVGKDFQTRQALFSG